jgi:hypothetical protein
MPRLPKLPIILAAATAMANSVAAFGLLGPAAEWQTERLGYLLNIPFAGSGPMNIGEEYRFNVPTLYYGFSPDFLNFFGQKGAQEIDKAFQMLNEMPAASSINLENAPLSSLRVNHRAAELSLYDLKSVTLGTMLHQMGVGDPIRFVFTLRSRFTTTEPDTTNFFVINRNFDPVTWRSTPFINGQLWTYSQVSDVSEAASFVFTTPVDPLALLGLVNAPVASGESSGTLVLGGFWTGLTRDDLGAIRYIYRRDNYNVETIAENVTGTAGGGPWGPPPGTTNATGTNFITTALRPGRERIQFRRANYDSTLGLFEAITNSYVDTYVTNAQAFKQNLERPLAAPDILFHVADLNGGDDTDTLIYANYEQAEWVNNDEINAPVDNLGPGVINAGVGGPALTLTFNSTTFVLWNIFPFNPMDELGALQVGFFWGSFDGTTNEPVVYPIGIEIRELEQRVLRGETGSGWRPPPFQPDPGDGGGGGGGGGGGDGFEPIGPGL